jgi:hypothetical protein
LDIPPDVAFAVGQALSSSESIEELSIRSCKLEDLGLATIAESIKFKKSLRVLHLKGNKITKEGLNALTEALRINTSVLKLSLAGTSEIEFPFFFLIFFFFFLRAGNPIGDAEKEELKKFREKSGRKIEIDVLDGNNEEMVEGGTQRDWKKEPWFSAGIDRKTAEKMLDESKVNRACIIRTATSSQLCISFYNAEKGKTKHLILEVTAKGFKLSGEKKKYKSMEALLQDLKLTLLPMEPTSSRVSSLEGEEEEPESTRQ